MMPMRWVDPDLFAVLSNDEKVYHCYRHDMIMTYHYQIFSDESDTGWMAFDIRDLFHRLDDKLKGTLAPMTYTETMEYALLLYPALEDALMDLNVCYEGEG